LRSDLSATNGTDRLERGHHAKVEHAVASSNTGG
jgi:hypothetical protein